MRYINTLKGLLVAVGLALSPALIADQLITEILYDDFEGEYTLENYNSKWANPFGLGELDPSVRDDTRYFLNGQLDITANPFLTAFDFSVFDHIKYFAISTSSYHVPEKGSLMFSADIAATTYGTEHGRIIEGEYGDGAPYAKKTLIGQQAAATLHMINFQTGLLYDWFVYDNKAFALAERLPSNVTGVGDVGLDQIYTQILAEFELTEDIQNFAIRMTRDENKDKVDFLIDGKVVAKVKEMGIPLDVQNKPFIKYPSLGIGENLDGVTEGYVIGHGLFSLLDEFPFQHPDLPEDQKVYIPIENRAFGQGVSAVFDNFKVTVTQK